MKFHVRAIIGPVLGLDEEEAILITDTTFAFLDKDTALRVARESDVINVAFSKDKDKHINAYVRN